MLLAVGLATASIAEAAQPSVQSLFLAIDEGSTARVETLLRAGANPNALDDRGEPALLYALHVDKPEVAETLIKAKGINLEAENRYGQTALMVAAYQGRLGMVQELIDADAEVNHKGWTALHFAASSGQVEVVKLLLENAAYIDAESPSRTTPLMMAARVKDRPTCVLLIQEGADPSPINAVGLAASDFARRAGDAELADWLAQAADAWRHAHPKTAPSALPASPSESGHPTGSSTLPDDPQLPASDPPSRPPS